MISKPEFKGCGTALITPFTTDGIDYECYETLIKRQLKSGVDFLVVLSTSAETTSLTMRERIKLVKLTRELASTTPLLLGVSSYSKTTTINNIKLYEKYADAFLVQTPQRTLSQSDLYNYFVSLASISAKPIVIHNVASKNNAYLETNTVLKLSRIPNIIGILDTSRNFCHLLDIIEQSDNNFKLYCANDDDILPLMAAGASGIISVNSNIIPKNIVKLCRMLESENYREARTEYYNLRELFKSTCLESSPTTIKSALSSIGLIENILRSPFFPASESNTIKIDLALENLDLI